MTPAFLAPGGVFVPSELDASVARVYYGVLGRGPDAGGLRYYEAGLSRGETLEIVMGHVLASPEYEATYGTPSNQQFVHNLYENTFGRMPEPGQVWTAMLDAGTSRTSVALGIAESLEARADMAPSIELGFKVY